MADDFDSVDFDDDTGFDFDSDRPRRGAKPKAGCSTWSSVMLLAVAVAGLLLSRLS